MSACSSIERGVEIKVEKERDRKRDRKREENEREEAWLQESEHGYVSHLVSRKVVIDAFFCVFHCAWHDKTFNASVLGRQVVRH